MSNQLPVAAGRRRFFRAALASAMFVCAVNRAHAAPEQRTTGSIRGIVRDATGAVLPGADVTLTSLDTGRVARVQSIDDGSYLLIAIPPSRYRIVFTRSGFAPGRRDLELALDQEISLSIALGPEGVTQSIIVVAESPLVDPSKTSLGRTVSEIEIDNLPLPAVGPRSFIALATLAPGVFSFTSASASSGVTSAGQSINSNSFAFDGLSQDAAVTGAQLTVPLEAIREFKVVSNHFTAEFGQASGAVLNVVTRSGSNAASARFQYFRQDSSWNATSAFAQDAGARDPGLQQDTWSGYGSVPLVPNRAFLFASAEYVAVDLVLRQRRARGRGPAVPSQRSAGTPVGEPAGEALRPRRRPHLAAEHPDRARHVSAGETQQRGA